MIREIVETIYRKIKSLNGGLVTIYNDNSQLIRRLNNSFDKATQYAQEVMAETHAINWFWECMSVMIWFQKAPGHRKEVKHFEQDPLSYLIQLCYREANKVRWKRCKREVSTKLE